MGRARQVRDALVLLASCAVVLAVLASNRGRRFASPPSAAASGAPLLPPPLPAGGEPERIAIPEQDVDAGCDFADRGFGVYERWRPLPLGKLLVPPAAAIGADGAYDLLVHFHGAEPIRKELAPRGFDLVIAGIDAGTRSSHYEQALGETSWDALRAAIDREVAAAIGAPAARARRVAVSSWSAGSGATQKILSRVENDIDAVVLLDSLYAGYAAGRAALVPGQLAGYVAMAGSAARGGPLFYMTHTRVPTYGYASTEETATFLLRELGAAPIEVSPLEGDPMPLVRMYDGGSLFVRGYGGSDREAHCAQLRLLPSIVAEHLLPAFAQAAAQPEPKSTP